MENQLMKRNHRNEKTASILRERKCPKSIFGGLSHTDSMGLVVVYRIEEECSKIHIIGHVFALYFDRTPYLFCSAIFPCSSVRVSTQTREQELVKQPGKKNSDMEKDQSRVVTVEENAEEKRELSGP
jgi:hypothetical protein